MKVTDRVTPTPAQEQAALAWLSLLHDRPSTGDQLTFSHWLRADPAHAEAYAQAPALGAPSLLARYSTIICQWDAGGWPEGLRSGRYTSFKAVLE